MRSVQLALLETHLKWQRLITLVTQLMALSQSDQRETGAVCSLPPRTWAGYPGCCLSAPGEVSLSYQEDGRRGWAWPWKALPCAAALSKSSHLTHSTGWGTAPAHGRSRGRRACRDRAPRLSAESPFVCPQPPPPPFPSQSPLWT